MAAILEVLRVKSRDNDRTIKIIFSRKSVSLICREAVEQPHAAGAL
jgi:hypothetical protein